MKTSKLLYGRTTKDLQQPGKEDFHLSSKWDFHNDVVTGVAPVETPPERATLIFFFPPSWYFDGGKLFK